MEGPTGGLSDLGYDKNPGILDSKLICACWFGKGKALNKLVSRPPLSVSIYHVWAWENFRKLKA